MSTERDTHFAGFANLLLTNVYRRFGHAIGSENSEQDEKIGQELLVLFAQRAYDLLEYNLDHPALQGCEVNELRVSDLYDLTAWPEQESNA